jgi:predicted nucleic acid-binding protein
VTLVDTSVWVDSFRLPGGVPRLADLLAAGDVLGHPWVFGELALGHLGPRRSSILRDLRRLPMVATLSDDEVLMMIDARRLDGSGLGWVDAHLLASALAARVPLWTHDRLLARAWVRAQ